MARQLLAEETLPAVAAEVDLDAYDRRILENYSGPDGRLKQIPTKLKKFEAILRYVAQSFKPGKQYTEKEVNQILGHYHEDTAMLRRGLVDSGMMDRESGGGLYWLTDN
jgi:hypothetical protein